MWNLKSSRRACEKYEARLEDAVERAADSGEGLSLGADLANHVAGCVPCSEALLAHMLVLACRQITAVVRVELATHIVVAGVWLACTCARACTWSSVCMCTCVTECDGVQHDQVGHTEVSSIRQAVTSMVFEVLHDTAAVVLSKQVNGRQSVAQML